MLATVTNILIYISTVKVKTMHFLSNILMLAFLELVVPFYFALHKSDDSEKSCPDHRYKQSSDGAAVITKRNDIARCL